MKYKCPWKCHFSLAHTPHKPGSKQRARARGAEQQVTFVKMQPLQPSRTQGWEHHPDVSDVLHGASETKRGSRVGFVWVDWFVFASHSTGYYEGEINTQWFVTTIPGVYIPEHFYQRWANLPKAMRSPHPGRTPKLLILCPWGRQASCDFSLILGCSPDFIPTSGTEISCLHSKLLWYTDWRIRSITLQEKRMSLRCVWKLRKHIWDTLQN